MFFLLYLSLKDIQYMVILLEILDGVQLCSLKQKRLYIYPIFIVITFLTFSLLRNDVHAFKKFPKIVIHRLKENNQLT